MATIRITTDLIPIRIPMELIRRTILTGGRDTTVMGMDTVGATGRQDRLSSRTQADVKKHGFSPCFWRGGPD
jgi:hypothetical protein